MGWGQGGVWDWKPSPPPPLQTQEDIFGILER